MSPTTLEDQDRARGGGTGGGPVLAPHPVLREHYVSESDRPAYLTGLFDASARHYDWINQVLSLGTGVRYRREALVRAGLVPGMRVIDVACGTGVISELAAGIVGSSGRVISVDPSRGMREEARRRRGIEAIDGTAENLPLPDGSADFLAMGYALRHVADLVVAFRQFSRVLRPGGRLLLLEITAPESPVGRGLLKFYLRAVIPSVMRLGSRSAAAQELMVYHWDSIQNCVRPPAILAAMGEAGLSDCRRRVELGIFSEYTAMRP